MFGYDPIYNNTAYSGIRDTTPPQFSIDFSGILTTVSRRATLTFEDARPKDIRVYYYRTLTRTAKTWMLKGNVGLPTAQTNSVTLSNNGAGSISRTATTNLSETLTTISYAEYSMTKIGTYDEGSYSEPSLYSDTYGDSMDNIYTYSNSNYRNALIVVNYTGETTCSYYFKHYNVNSAT